MQMDMTEPAAVPAAGGKPPTICDRLQRAFHTGPAFRPLRRLTGHPQDGGAPGAAGIAATHGGVPPPVPVPLPPRTPVPSQAGNAPAPVAPATLKPAGAKGGGKPGQLVPASTVPAVTATTSNAAEKAAADSAGGMPLPPPAASGGPPAAGVGDKAQKTKGRTRVGSRVRKALASSK